MEQYDVVIIGGGLGSLTTAAYLSKRLRNVAVFEEGKQRKLLKYTNRIKDDLNNKFVFKFFHHDVGGVHEGNLFYEYLKRCGLEAKFSYYDNDYSMIIDQEKRIVKRPNDFDNFRTYLIRRYPKQRDEIHNLFEDIKRHYEDYRLQKMAKLKNKEHTISSLLIEWGDLDLNAVLSKYFHQKEIINEFTLVYDAVGHKVEEINAYNYFIKFFDTFIDGSHFIQTSFNDLVKGFSAEISKTKEKIFTNRRIQKFIIEDNKISYIIDQDGNEVYAKHYVINMRIDEFIDEYANDFVEQKQEFENMYENIHNGRYINQLYIGLDSASEKLGISEKQYIFSEFEDDTVRICSVMNYKAIDPDSCEKGKGALLVEFIDDLTPRKQKTTQVVDQLCTYFPGLIDHITVSKIGVKQPYFSGKEKKEYWANKTVNDKFNIDNYRSVNPFSNTYFIGSWLRPEAGITGMIQTGVEYGDMIDDQIYRGDDEDYFITHEELMAIISNQFIPGALGKEEKNIQFFIGKDSYFIRIKAKHLRVYKGVSEISDVIIIATNDCLYDLSVGNTTLDKAINNGSLEYVGERDFLNDVIEAFDMGIEVHKITSYKYRPGRWGILSAGAIFSILLLANLLANYHPYLIIAPSTIGLLLIVGYIKYRLIKYISLFEIVSVSLYSLLLVVSILFEEVNTFEDSRYTTLFFAVYLLATWLINKPVLFGYIKYDYRSDYTRTKLFKKMASGLTFIWGFMFLIISVMNFAYSSTYSTLSYYLVVMGIYLMYYYPTTYIKGNIVK
jgi:prolycopene isomerase